MHTMQNLWPDFDNKQLQAESAGRAQKQSTSQRRRPTEQVVLSTLREWLLHEYIVPYCRSLDATRIFRRCYWQSIKQRPSSHSTHLHIQCPFPLRTSLLSISVPRLQNSACSFHRSRSRVV